MGAVAGGASVSSRNTFPTPSEQLLRKAITDTSAAIRRTIRSQYMPLAGSGGVTLGRYAATVYLTKAQGEGRIISALPPRYP